MRAEVVGGSERALLVRTLAFCAFFYKQHGIVQCLLRRISERRNEGLRGVVYVYRIDA